MKEQSRSWIDMLYWPVTLGMVAFGLIATITFVAVGIPFLLLGALFIVLSPVRRRPNVLWPGAVGALFFVVAVVVVAPRGCTVKGGARDDHQGRTRFLPMDYSGGGDYDPSYWPALAAGIGTGGVAAAVTRFVLGAGGTRRHRRRPRGSP